MEKKMRYLAIAAAIAVLMSAGGCGKQEVVETTTDVAAVESASDVVATTVGTEQTTTVSSTSAQEEITLVTATAPTTAEKAVETAKATQNTTKKTTAKAATAKTTVKTTAKPQPKTTAKATTKATTKQSGVTKEDILWAQQKANEYIKTLPKAKFNPDAGGYSCDNGAPWGAYWITSKEQVYSKFKRLIDSEYQRCIECGWNGIEMYLKVAFDDYGWDYWCMYTIL